MLFSRRKSKAASPKNWQVLVEVLGGNFGRCSGRRCPPGLFFFSNPTFGFSVEQAVLTPNQAPKLTLTQSLPFCGAGAGQLRQETGRSYLRSLEAFFLGALVRSAPQGCFVGETLAGF